jgi:DNA-binding NarL/FixJ family response regulator
MMNIKVGITDDHLLVINGLRAMLDKFAHISVIFSENTGDALLKRLKEDQPDVLFLDIQMPGSNGIDLCKQITRDYPDVKVIALTNFEESHYIKQMMRNGAQGYLLKNTDQNTLIEAIETVYKGQQYIDKYMQNALLNEMISGKKRNISEVFLTKRELEILELIAKEHTNQEIADKLFISLRTVQTHRLNITQKLDAKNTAALVKEAYKRGLI